MNSTLENHGSFVHVHFIPVFFSINQSNDLMLTPRDASRSSQRTVKASWRLELFSANGIVYVWSTCSLANAYIDAYMIL